MSCAADATDPFDVNILRVHPEAVRERGEDARLVRSVVAVDVEVRRRLRVAELLRIGEHLREVRALLLHAREDVIARTIHDAVEARDAVADQTFAQDFDDRDAASDAGFVVKIRVVLLRGFEELLAVRGEQCLVRGDDRLAEAEGGEHRLPRGRRPAHEFDNEIDVGMIDDGGPVRGENAAGNGDGAFLLEIAHGHGGDAQADAEAGGHELAVALDALIDAAADRATADDSEIHLPHKGTHRVPRSRASDNSFFVRAGREGTDGNRNDQSRGGGLGIRKYAQQGGGSPQRSGETSWCPLNLYSRRDSNINCRLLHGKAEKNLLLVSAVVVIVAQLPVRVCNSRMPMLLKVNRPVSVPVEI